MPNLSEHLSSAETTSQLSARFGYAAAMKSINNLLLLGDGETWNRQRIDFAGLPEMVRTFLQVAAAAADIPVTRLLGQSPAGLSATGESDTRNTYDMIAARQELELRPALERLDRIVAASEGITPDTLTFAFRPLWQLDAATAATIALQKAQATQIYAGLNLWPTATTARLVAAQLAEDGTYPNARAVFGEGGAISTAPTRDDFNPDQLRNKAGEWTTEGDTSDVPLTAVGLLGEGKEGLRTKRRLRARAREREHEERRRRERPDKVDEPSVPARPGETPERPPEDTPADRHETEAPDDLKPASPRVDPTPSGPATGTQTEKNKLAQSLDPRIRSDLADKWIQDGGKLNWPIDNNGAGAPETPITLEPGQIVGRYGDDTGAYLSPPGTSFPERSLPYDPQRTPLRTFRVLKPFTVESGRVAPWFDEPGGGVQFRTSTRIRGLVSDGYLDEED